MTDAEQIAVTKLWYVAKHLNISDPPQPTDLLTAVALVEHAAEWARMHIERRGKENDELREQAIKLAAGQFAAHEFQTPLRLRRQLALQGFVNGRQQTLA